jgi:hypothetical protein
MTLQSVSPAVVDAAIAKQWQADNAVHINPDPYVIYSEFGELMVLDRAGKPHPFADFFKFKNTDSFTAADHKLTAWPKHDGDELLVNTSAAVQGATASTAVSHPTWPEAFEHSAFAICGAAMFAAFVIGMIKIAR